VQNVNDLICLLMI